MFNSVALQCLYVSGQAFSLGLSVFFGRLCCDIGGFDNRFCFSDSAYFFRFIGYDYLFVIL